MKLLRKTKSLCPVCLSELDANIFEDDGKAVMKKECKNHGEFSAVIEKNVELYKKLAV